MKLQWSDGLDNAMFVRRSVKT